MGDKDIISKEAIRRLAFDIATRILGLEVDADSVELIETEYHRIEERRADLVVLVRDARTGQPFILHIEVQNDNAPLMPLRMLRYLTDIEFARPGVEIRQYLIYIGARPLTMPDHITRPRLSYSYGLIDMRDIDCRQFLERDHPDALLLAILCDFGGRDPQAVVNHIFQRLQGLLADTPKRLREYVEMIAILSTNRGLEAHIHEAERMLTYADIERLPTYTLGMERGMERGIEQGEARVLLRMLHRRFDPLPTEIAERVQQAHSDQLEEWSDRILTAASLDEVFR